MKFAPIALACALAISAPAFAQSENDQDIKSDVGAINKDNTALQHDQEKLDTHRAEKAEDKANGNYGSQAVDSVKIGADKTAMAEKKAERHADKKILKHHKKKVHKDMGDKETSTAPASGSAQ